jgi:NADP-dependent 3-hydroxy acid dehydrogenase YdfG
VCALEAVDDSSRHSLNLVLSRVLCASIYPSTSSICPSIRLDGQVALVTGVTRGGIGYETARVLAGRGAHVILAGRRMKDLESSKHAIERSVTGCCRQTDPDAVRLTCLTLDLTDLASVRSCALAFRALNLPLHILVNNAGILSPGYRLSAQGVESQMATNHLGHFYLTALLMHALRAAGNLARVVNVSSVAHHQGNMHVQNVAASFCPTKERYDEWTSYGETGRMHLRISSRFVPCSFPYSCIRSSRQQQAIEHFAFEGTRFALRFSWLVLLLPSSGCDRE